MAAKKFPLPKSSIVRFTPNGQFCVVCGDIIQFVSAETGVSFASVWDQPRATWLSLAPNGQTIAWKNADGPICVSPVVAGALPARIAQARGGAGARAELSADGKSLVDASQNDGLNVFSLVTGKVTFRHKVPDMWLDELLCSAKRDTWISVHRALGRTGEPNQARFLHWTWPFDKARCEILPFRAHCYLQSALSADGDLLALISGAIRETTLQIFSVTRRLVLHTQPIQEGPLSQPMRWSPCGRYLAIGERRAVQIFDFQKREFVAEIGIPWAESIDFSPDGKLIAMVGSQSGRIEPFALARKKPRRAPKEDVSRRKRPKRGEEGA